MPLADPTAYRDKTLDWMAWFSAARRDSLRALVTPELIAEHAHDPFGIDVRHSADLQAVLILLRAAPTLDKPFAYAEQPHRKYRLGRMRGRGNRPLIEGGKAFTSERAAVHAVFLARLAWLGLLPAPRAKRGGGR